MSSTAWPTGTARVSTRVQSKRVAPNRVWFAVSQCATSIIVVRDLVTSVRPRHSMNVTTGCLPMWRWHRVVDHVVGLIAKGVDGVSIEFHSPPVARWNVTASAGVSGPCCTPSRLEPMGAYPTARVLAVRSHEADDIDEWLSEAQQRQQELERRFAKPTVAVSPLRLIPNRPTSGDHDASWVCG